MEKILSGEVQPQRAALLLRAVQIANQSLRRELQEETRRKPAGQAGSRSPDNPEEIVG